MFAEPNRCALDRSASRLTKWTAPLVGLAPSGRSQLTNAPRNTSPCSAPKLASPQPSYRQPTPASNVLYPVREPHPLRRLRPWTRSHLGGPAAKSRGLRSPVARRLARSWQTTAPTHGTWRPPKAPDSRAFATLRGRSIPPTSALRLHSARPPLRKTPRDRR